MHRNYHSSRSNNLMNPKGDIRRDKSSRDDRQIPML